MNSAPTDLAQVAQFLHDSILFQDAGDAELGAIARRLELVKYHQGDPIVLENQISDHVYFVYSGSVEVVKHLKELNQLHRLAVLGPGRQFSEFSVLNRASKAASVFAMEDCELLRMSGESFLEVLHEFPLAAKRLVLHLADMTQCVQSSRLHLDYVKGEMVRLNNQILEIMPVKQWRKFEALPLRLEGRNLVVAVKDPQNKEFYRFMAASWPNLHLHINLINDADFDVLEKELQQAYMQNQKQPAPIAPRPVPPPLPGELASWIPKISLFRELPPDWIQQLAACFTFETFKAGQHVYKRGEVSEKLYFVVSGSAEALLPLGVDNASVFVGNIGPGDYFAEISLLTQNPHLLSVRAQTELQVAVLSKDYLERFLEAPFISVAMGRDLAIQFQAITSIDGFNFFDPTAGVQVGELAHILPLSIVSQYEILPLRLVDGELTIGMTNPESETVYSVISRYLHNYRVKLEVIKPADFKKWSNELSGANATSTAVAGATVGRPTSANLAKGDAVAVTNKMFLEGLEKRASDIHFEPNGECYIVRYRVDGVLHEGSEKYSKALGAEIVNRLKVLSQMDVTNRFTPQDGQLKFEVNHKDVAARLSILPTKLGEAVVARLIREKSSVPPLATLVPDQRVLQILRDVVNTKQGVFLVTGPTGSGKSTTLYSLIQELNRVEVSLISLEDPVEMTIPGTTQVEINEKTGLTFSTALRSALRQDPNVIIIGEIRDEESAKIAFHAAATGHLVISTLHTNDSLSVVPRLVELGVERGLLASTLIGASAQRLVRQNCRKCMTHRPIEAHEAEVLTTILGTDNLPQEVAVGTGCSACGQSGFHGRIPVIEVWEKTFHMENLLTQTSELEVLAEVVREQKFETLHQFALKMALNGLTTVAEAQRCLGRATVRPSFENGGGDSRSISSSGPARQSA